ncbi:hypothetical protein [Polyangium aurulentum]|uniref:hypothetical protein n=1 Tax=Polyangium aurulentum TaxID=2567896 RepID=UPI00146E8213|nr:hypothetical protein [Polyangium aurulentum]UQA58766.1 hypothetical protein E8A73_047335 [Polyangium aurulentum]
MHVRHPRTALLAALLFTLTASARAKEPPRRLVYIRGPGTEHCPEEEYLKAATRAELGYDPFDATASGQLVVTLSRDEAQGRIDFTLELLDPDGTRGQARRGWGPIERCDQTLLNAGLRIATLYEPFPGTPEPLPSSPPVPAEPPEASPPPPVKTAIAPPAPKRAAPRPAQPTSFAWKARWISLSLSAGAAWNSAPGVAPSIASQVAVRWPRWSVGAEGRIDPSGSGDVPNGSASASLFGAALVGCGRHDAWLRHLSLLACVQVLPARLFFEEKGNTARRTVVGLGPRASAELRIRGPLRARLDVDATSFLPIQSFERNGLEVWRMPLVTISTRLGLVYLHDL